MSGATRIDRGHDKELSATAARLLQRLWADDPTSVARLAEHARVPLDNIDAWREGRTRVGPDEQMRIAAAIVSVAPQPTRSAHRLDAQAHAELRYVLGLVGAHDSYAAAHVAIELRPGR